MQGCSCHTVLSNLLLRTLQLNYPAIWPSQTIIRTILQNVQNAPHWLLRRARAALTTIPGNGSPPLATCLVESLLERNRIGIVDVGNLCDDVFHCLLFAPTEKIQAQIVFHIQKILSEMEVPKFNGATVLWIALLCVRTECRERNRASLEDSTERWDRYEAYPARKAFIEAGFAMLFKSAERRIKTSPQINFTSWNSEHASQSRHNPKIKY